MTTLVPAGRSSSDGRGGGSNDYSLLPRPKKGILTAPDRGDLRAPSTLLSPRTHFPSLSLAPTARMFRKLFKKNKVIRCAVLGPEFSGKTTLCYALSHDNKFIDDIKFSGMDRGFNDFTISRDSYTIHLTDLPNETLSKSGWENLCWDKDVLLFVVDSTCSPRDMTRTARWFRQLARRPSLATVPIIVVGAKIDMADASRSTKDIFKELELQELSRYRRAEISCWSVSTFLKTNLNNLVEAVINTYKVQQGRSERRSSPSPKPHRRSVSFCGALRLCRSSKSHDVVGDDEDAAQQDSLRKDERATRPRTSSSSRAKGPTSPVFDSAVASAVRTR